ncbi:MAG: hypothetical protein K2N72_03335 [Oscillospiraceae bacterium]|nr:hypothetical protein [Oscillospiraceae bacterium]
MFKKSRFKIVAAIMSVLALLFLGTLAVIYISSYIELSERNHAKLEGYAKLYYLEKDTNGNIRHAEPPKPDKPVGGAPKEFYRNRKIEETQEFQLSTFYSVAVSDSGEILVSDNGDGAVYEKDLLEKYAYEIIKSRKEKGVKGNLTYISADKGEYTLVAFMDNTIISESMTMLFRYTLVFGSITIIILFFVAVYLARQIVRPLEESYQKQKQFISDAGHELKTPISVVSANAELLTREIGNNQWLANIQHENERMGMLVEQFLELAKTENVTPQIEHLDISRLTAGESLPFESVAFEKGLTLNCDIAEGLFVNGSSIQLRQLVSILIDNAVSHSAEGNEIYLVLKEERGFAKLSVINSGSEIPAEQRKQLFDRFYRADTARNGDDKHYGLGLAIAKAIVTSHKGKIGVSCYDGKIEFTVKLPLSQH